jgi:hypothetical protein
VRHETTAFADIRSTSSVWTGWSRIINIASFVRKSMNCAPIFRWLRRRARNRDPDETGATGWEEAVLQSKSHAESDGLKPGRIAVGERRFLADFVAKLFAALPTRNYRIREAGISNPILRTLARP